MTTSMAYLKSKSNLFKRSILIIKIIILEITWLQLSEYYFQNLLGVGNVYVVMPVHAYNFCALIT